LSRRYEVLVDKRVEKDLRKVPVHIRGKFIIALDLLAQDSDRIQPE